MYTTAATYGTEQDRMIFGEKSGHLGNVRAVVSDIRKPVDITGDIDDWTWTADVTDHFSYYPFGMMEPGRQKQLNTVDAGGYKFGFNGKLRDDSWHSAAGTVYDYGFRIYDARIAKFLSVDPLIHNYPFYSSFQYAGNNPVLYIDLDGLEPAEGSHNYGNNIIFSNKKIVDNVLNNSKNVNWHAHKIRNLEDVYNQIKSYKDQGYKVKNIVISSHGGNNTLSIVGNDIADIDMQSNLRITGTTVAEFIEYQSLMGDPEVNSDRIIDLKNGGEGLNEIYFESLSILQNIMNEVEKGGKIIFASCLTGNYFNEDGSSDIAQQLSKLAPGRKLYFNRDYSRPDITLDAGITGPRNFILGWKGSVQTKNESLKKLLNKDIILSSSGNRPVTSVKYKFSLGNDDDN